MMRNGTIDLMRLVAAGGIVLFHAQSPGQAIGLSGLHFFLMLIPVLMFAAPPFQKTLAETALGKASRLLLPWLTWSAIFGSLKIMEVAATDATLEQEFFPWMLATGPALHLWFLPFAFVVSVICAALASPVRALLALSPWSGPMVAAASLALAVIVVQSTDLGHPPPLAQYLAAIPALLAGLAFVGLQTVRQKTVLCGAIILLATLMGWTNGFLQLSIASLALLLCFATPARASQPSSVAASMSLTVYLAHPLVLSALERAAGLDHGSIEFGWIGLTATAALAFLLSLGLSDRRTPASLKRLLG